MCRLSWNQGAWPPGTLRACLDIYMICCTVFTAYHLPLWSQLQLHVSLCGHNCSCTCLSVPCPLLGVITFWHCKFRFIASWLYNIHALLHGLFCLSFLYRTAAIWLWCDEIWYMIYLLTAVGLHPVAIVQYSTVQYSTVQYTFTHKQYTEQHNETEHTEHNIHNNKNT